jgi:hypothetical protein
LEINEKGKPMNETARILCAISSTEHINLKRFSENLGEDKPTWDLTHSILLALEEQEAITIRRNSHVITGLKLTPLGAERAREAMEGDKLPERKPNSKSGLVIDA